MKEVMVSVVCTTYNHEKYIRQCLDGFVAQNTSFLFEILIHDDASTDKTADIIREYEIKYPGLFRTIYQKENQYSKHINILARYIFPYVRGKYVAYCEGDDYWCDPFKLQKQYDYMEEHPDCSLCVHNTRVINEDGSFSNSWLNYTLHDLDYSIDDIIRSRGSGFHTSSFFYRSLYLELPNQFFIEGVGDYNRAIYLSSKGNVHYICETMSCYRIGSTNSWTVRTHRNIDQLRSFYSSMIHGLIRIGEELGEEHDKAIKEAINQYELDLFLLSHCKYFAFLSPLKFISLFNRIKGRCDLHISKKQFLNKMYYKKRGRIHE